jgi:predicted short-subunit dehydrogenase-like oxidoreductase (DUF2520 family)
VETISIIGLGRVGGALAIALSRAGFQVEKLIYRSSRPQPAVLERVEGRAAVIQFEEVTALDSDLVLVTTSDTALDSVAQTIAPKLHEGSVLVHTSGALSSEVLVSAARLGIATGSMHPLVSVSDSIIGSDNFAGAYFCVEGSSQAVMLVEELVRALGGSPFSIDTVFKPLYHASAVLASGHLVALFAAAVETLSHCGVNGSKAKEIFLPLVESTVANLSGQSVPEALTGPFARADLAAVERHLEAFDSEGLGAERRIYLELGNEALRLAEINGGDGEKIARIRNLIKLALAAGK